MGQRYIWDGTRWVEPAVFFARQSQDKRSALSSPRIVSDAMDDVVNPLDGKPYDSKSSYYRTVKTAGCEIDDRSFEDQHTDHKVHRLDKPGEDIKQAIDQLEAS